MRQPAEHHVRHPTSSCDAQGGQNVGVIVAVRRRSTRRATPSIKFAAVSSAYSRAARSRNDRQGELASFICV